MMASKDLIVLQSFAKAFHMPFQNLTATILEAPGIKQRTAEQQAPYKSKPLATTSKTRPAGPASVTEHRTLNT